MNDIGTFMISQVIFALGNLELAYYIQMAVQNPEYSLPRCEL